MPVERRPENRSRLIDTIGKTKDRTLGDSDVPGGELLRVRIRSSHAPLVAALRDAANFRGLVLGCIETISCE